MRFASIYPAMAAVFLMAADQEGGKRVTFENAAVGQVPKGWSTAKTGKGAGSVWKIAEDTSAPGGPKVLAQTSAEGPGPLYNLCVMDDSSYRDLDLSLAFKAVAGKIDQGGGPVWRYRDANNYYIARMNPLEGNFRVYKVVDGKRTQLGSADIDAAANKWHTIRIVQKGNHIQCYLNDKMHLDVKDDTFKEGGKIGLWTKADAQTSFADLKISDAK